MEASKSAGKSDVQQVMERIETILPPCPSEGMEADRLRHFEHVTSFLLRYGARREDPIQRMLAHVGNYWSSAILITLRSGALRPSALQKLLGTLSSHQPISQRMLTLNLRTLEEDGLIERRVHDPKNLHVEYQLTQMGWEFSGLIMPIIEWSGNNFQRIVSAREHYVAPVGHSSRP